MPIIKSTLSREFTQIANSTLRDSRLPIDTRGYLCEMLSYSEEFDVSVEWLLNRLNVGREKLVRMNRELKKFGYLEITAATDKEGKFRGKSWNFFGLSSENRITEKPYYGKTVVRKNRSTENPFHSSVTYNVQDNVSESCNVKENITCDFFQKSPIPPNSPPPQEAQPKKKPIKLNTVWTDLKSVLIAQGTEQQAAGAMIGKLIKTFGAERVDRVFTTNRDLILEQTESYGYFYEILKRDKSVNKDEAEIQEALKASQTLHRQIYSGLEFSPPYDARSYLNQFPALNRYVEELDSGLRSAPLEDTRERERLKTFDDMVREQARFYERI